MVPKTVGIDIGTTSIKICVVAEDERILEFVNKAHNATVTKVCSQCSEQDVEKVFTAIKELIGSVKTPLNTVSAVCVTGQMHGIVLWNSSALLQGTLCCSRLITWMDCRVSKEFINNLPKWRENELHPGYGVVTLAWLQKSGEVNKLWDCCGTIMDMLNCYIARLPKSVIGIQNAFSWGYCTIDGQWTIPESIVPSGLLPQIVDSNKIIGHVQLSDFGIPVGASIFASLGDLQSTVYPLLKNERCAAFLNLGTSAQLGCIRPKNNFHSSFCVPFFGEDCLAVAASMNGGNVLQFLADKIIEWASVLTSQTNLTADFRCFEQILNEPYQPSSLKVEPTFHEERTGHVISTIQGICGETSLTNLFHESCAGVVRNLIRMFPDSLLHDFGIQKLILAGNAGKSYYLRVIEEYFKGFEIVKTSETMLSASVGAALFALNEYAKLENVM